MKKITRSFIIPSYWRNREIKWR